MSPVQITNGFSYLSPVHNEDLLVQILACLPVRELGRVAAVSRLWRLAVQTLVYKDARFAALSTLFMRAHDSFTLPAAVERVLRRERPSREQQAFQESVIVSAIKIASVRDVRELSQFLNDYKQPAYTAVLVARVKEGALSADQQGWLAMLLDKLGNGVGARVALAAIQATNEDKDRLLGDFFVESANGLLDRGASIAEACDEIGVTNIPDDDEHDRSKTRRSALLTLLCGHERMAAHIFEMMHPFLDNVDTVFYLIEALYDNERDVEAGRLLELAIQLPGSDNYYAIIAHYQIALGDIAAAKKTILQIRLPNMRALGWLELAAARPDDEEACAAVVGGVVGYVMAEMNEGDEDQLECAEETAQQLVRFCFRISGDIGPVERLLSAPGPAAFKDELRTTVVECALYNNDFRLAYDYAVLIQKVNLRAMMLAQIVQNDVFDDAAAEALLGGAVEAPLGDVKQASALHGVERFLALHIAPLRITGSQALDAVAMAYAKRNDFTRAFYYVRKRPLISKMGLGILSMFAARILRL